MGTYLLDEALGVLTSVVVVRLGLVQGHTDLLDEISLVV